MEIFQIRDVRIHNGLTKTYINRGIKTMNKSETLLWSDEKVWGVGGKALESKTITIEEELVATQWFSRDERITQFNNLASSNMVDIIAYMHLDELGIAHRDYQTDISNAYKPPILWLHTSGSLMDTDNSARNQFRATFEINPSWQPLNRYDWFYSDRIETRLLKTPSANAYEDLFPMPTYYDVEAYTRWNRQYYDDPLYNFSADNWLYRHAYLPSGYPRTGFVQPLSNGVHFVVINDVWLWASESTTTMYQFHNLEDLGGITISVQSQKDVWSYDVTTSTVNLAKLNTDLAANGYTGLLAGDILYVANYEGMRSFVMRGTEIIDRVTPEWVFTGDSIGETGRGRNVITFSYTIPGNKQVSFMGTYRII